MADAAWLKKQRTRLFDELFQEAHNIRRDEWRPVVKRQKPTSLPVELKDYWADMQDPICEDDMSQRIGILMLDQTKIDFAPMGEGEQYERDVEKMRLYSAVSQLKQNQGRWRDQYIAEGQVLDGVAIIRKLVDMPKEPDTKDEKEREDYFKDLDHWPFREVGVDFLQCAWDGEDMENPTIFMQEASKRYYEAKDDWQVKGKKWQLNKLKEVVILGPDITLDEPDNAQDQEIKFLICDYKDPASGTQYICQYVYAAGNYDGGEVVFEDVNPMGRCSYFVIPSGELRRHETNPHWRYRPMMLALLVWVYRKGFILSLLAAMAQRAISDRNVLLSTKGVSPELMRGMQGVGVGFSEGAGAEGPSAWHPPELPPGDIPVVAGDLLPWPNNISEQLEIILSECNTAIQDYRANRFLTGQVSENVVSQATATSFSRNTQAAALPFGRALVMSDEYQRTDIESEYVIILYWEEAKPAGAAKPYHATSPRSMRFIGGEHGLGGEAKAGQTVRITAEMVKTRKFLVNVQTANDTEEELFQKAQRAFIEFENKTLDDLQLYRRLGHDDPRAQQKTMAKFEARQMAAVAYIPHWQATLAAFFEATAGVPIATPPAPMLPVGPSAAPQGGGPAQSPIPPPQGVTGGNNGLSGLNGMGG